MLKHLLFSFLALAFLASCAKSEKSEGAEARTSQAISHMERGEYDLAIEILSELRVAHPEDSNLSLHLASAFAGRAGLKVENYWGFVVGYKGVFKKNTEGLTPQSLPQIDLKGFESQAGPEVRGAVKNFNQNLKEFFKIKQRLDQVPYLNAQKRKDLYRGLDVIKEHPTPGGRLYRAVLGVVIARSTIIDTSRSLEVWSKSGRRLCGPEFRLLADWVGFSVQILAELAGDLAHAFPKDKTQLLKAEVELSRAAKVTRELMGQTRQGAALCARP
ncbi:MAG: hypothetical protein ACK5P7_06140 [Bdellovibrio sp.]